MRPGLAILAWWRHARPEAWMVSLLPTWVGWLLARHEILPGQALLLADGPLDVRAYLVVTWPWFVGSLVMGPLLWTATLLWNDAADLPGDRLNPRKARSPLVAGIVGVGWALRVAAGAALFALVLAWWVGPTFFLLVTACLALAYAYSRPPLRWKTRPGADVAVNAVGVGVLAAMAGWSLAAPLVAFPWPFLWQGLLVAIAVYVPTTLVDREADAAAGYATLATHLGERRAYQVGWWAWVGANAGAVGLAAADAIIPRSMLPVLLVFAPLLLWQYHRFIGGAKDAVARVEGIVLCSLTFAAVNALFALHYTGQI